MYRIRYIILLLLLLFISGCVNDFHIVDINDDYSDSSSGVISKDSVIDCDLLDNSSDYSISFWIKPKFNYLDSFLFTLVNSNDEFIRVSNSIENSSGSYGINLWLSSDGDHWLTGHSDFSLYTNRYNHIVFTKDHLNLYSLYLNGDLVGSNIFDSDFDMDDLRLVIGYDCIYDSNHSEGSYRDLKVYDYILDSSSIKDEYDLYYPNIILDNISFNNMDDRIFDLVLYPQIDSTYDAIWTSSDEDIIDIVNNKGIINDDILVDSEVTLRVSSTINDIEYYKDFVFMVRANNSDTFVDRDLELVDNYLGHIINDGDVLIDYGSYGSKISYQVMDGDVEIVDYNVIKNSNVDKENISIKVVVTNGSVSKEFIKDLILLDEYYGYALMYFDGELGSESVYLAHSIDGLNWTNVSDSALLSASIGNNRLRDPHISRDKDGYFNIVLTQGFDTNSIYYYHSKDLIDFESESLSRIVYLDRGLGLSGLRAWAPESYYDDSIDAYRVIFSDPLGYKSGAIFETITKDFINYSYPSKIFSPNYPVIDGTIINDRGYYYMYYKDERDGVSSIFYSVTNDLSEGFELKYDDLFLSKYKYVEGPIVFDDIYSNNRIIYLDNYPNGVYLVGYIIGDSIEWLDIDQYSLPNGIVKHGSIIKITKDEYDKLLSN